MHKVIILAYCAVSLSSVFSNQTHTLDKLVNKNVTILTKISGKISFKPLNKSNETKQNEDINSSVHARHNRTQKANNTSHSQMIYDSSDEAQRSFQIIQRIHTRITRSKNAVWAAVTLTFMCILLVLAVAQSRMWRDNYYSEVQGIPLPNFNERHLFKDVMEHKMATLKRFFKKKEKKKDVTELESLLPPSEWDD